MITGCEAIRRYHGIGKLHKKAEEFLWMKINCLIIQI